MGASTNQGTQEGFFRRVETEKKMKVEMELGFCLGVWSSISQLW